jgi:tRNA-splicing ligase RtcB (3'-phosphate/5'-hydroxy nucleic acid ligase)
MSKLVKIGPAQYEIKKYGGMLVPGLVIANEELLQETEMTKALQQVENVAYLPGIVGYSIAMPDIHWGYGFPIGGVAAMEAEQGVISPGGVGYDINCGVRLALAPLPFASLTQQTKHQLLQQLFRTIPSGVGHGQKEEKPLSEEDYRSIARHGMRWAIEHGDGYAADLDHSESLGCIAGADSEAVSSVAKQRGDFSSTSDEEVLSCLKH